MGNTQNKNPINRQIDVFHEKFKMVQIMENTEEMILTIPYEQKADIIQWEKLLKNVRDCDPQFLLMPKKYMIAEEGICGSSGVIKVCYKQFVQVVFDCFTYSFEQEIRNHAQKYKHFQQTQIWYLLFAIISSTRQLNRLSMKVGDIRPHNIFVNQNGQVKLSGSYSWPRQVQNYLKTAYDRTVTYLAPEQLHQCRVGEKGKRSHIVGESFSVGLTLLHTCLLKPMDELYNVKKFQFNVERLEGEISELKKLSFWNQEKERNQKYSPQLVNIIVGLLELNQGKRLSSLELFDQLEPHAEEILNLREFEIPHFTTNTPTKQQPKTNGASSNQQQRVSPPYSSIQRKQFHQPESLAFETSYGLGGIGSRDINTGQNSISFPVMAVERKTPQKRVKSKQKMQVSLSPEKVNVFSKTSQPPRQSLQLGKQKFNSNPQVNYSVPNSQVQNRTYDGNFPSTYQYAGEFKTYDAQYQPYRPSIGSTLGQNVDKKFQAPQFNYATSNYVTYKNQYEIPAQTTHQRMSQPTTFSFNQPQTTSINFKPSVAPQQRPTFQQPPNPYPFTRNVEFAKSQYTVLDSNVPSQPLQQRVSVSVSNQQATGYQTTPYQTSIVKPMYGGEMSFGTGFGQGNNEVRNQSEEPSELLKKINEQLNKSKQMYPTGTAF